MASILQRWRCTFCSATVVYNAAHGMTQGVAVREHLRCCVVLAPLIRKAMTYHKAHKERQRHESKSKYRK